MTKEDSHDAEPKMNDRKTTLLVTIRLPGAFEATGNALALRRFLELIKEEFKIHLVTGDRGLNREAVPENSEDLKVTVIKTKPATKLLWLVKLIPIILKGAIIFNQEDGLGVPKRWKYTLLMRDVGRKLLIGVVEKHENRDNHKPNR